MTPQLDLVTTPPPKPCGWCLYSTATTHYAGTPSCEECARPETDRVRRWLDAVGGRR